ncbi:MAG: hypothetical protein ABIJ97_01015 [Bacteroidota bacterium]
MHLNLNFNVFLFLLVCIVSGQNININKDDNNCLYLGTDQLDSLTITQIKITEFLTVNQKERLKLNDDIFSKETMLSYRKGRLIKEIWKYTGIDAAGIDHMSKKKGGFSSYGYENEEDYNTNIASSYTSKNELSFDENLKIIQILDRGQGDLLINSVSADEFIMLNYSENHDFEYLMINPIKSRLIYFKLNR